MSPDSSDTSASGRPAWAAFHRPGSRLKEPAGRRLRVSRERYRFRSALSITRLTTVRVDVHQATILPFVDLATLEQLSEPDC
jgi:hypothetical protein